MNREKVFDFISEYAPKPEEIKESARTAAMNQMAEKEREKRIDTPKKGSELEKLYAQLEEMNKNEAECKETYSNLGIEYQNSVVFDHEKVLVEESIRAITSGKREAEIKQRMEEIEIYFVEKGKGFKVNDDINGFLHPILKSRQREYDNLYDELHNLY